MKKKSKKVLFLKEKYFFFEYSEKEMEIKYLK